jgi:hypothetical protein
MLLLSTVNMLALKVETVLHKISRLHHLNFIIILAYVIFLNFCHI